jgi:hypothetical protein
MNDKNGVSTTTFFFYVHLQLFKFPIKTLPSCTKYLGYILNLLFQLHFDIDYPRWRLNEKHHEIIDAFCFDSTHVDSSQA